ncbi:MAG: pyruvate kinase, partial [Chloroflexi bacterium]|nr:pyruvate kinase [Chloroflexota bacterium]
QDLQGPKIRVGVLDAPLNLTIGQTVELYPQRGASRITHHASRFTHHAPRASIPVDFPELFRHVESGDRILLDDGRLELTALEADGKIIVAEVKTGGELLSHKGINLPGVRLDIPSFTEKDADDLSFGLSLGVDAVAVSFVRSAQDVSRVRQAIDKLAPQNPPFLVAKLERPEALDDLEKILELADGVMVARGDLGVEMAPEEVPIAQKRIIQAANRAGKLVITATQMLESMIHNPLPTRAEASDVANAIFDGSDAVMLSAETAVGEYPLESVAIMDRIIRQAEAGINEWGHVQRMEVSRRAGVALSLSKGAAQNEDAAAIANAARELAHDRDVAAIAVFTRGGRTAAIMAKARPCVPILAFTPEMQTYRRLAMFWGVIPQIVPFADTLEEMLAHVETALRASGSLQPGQQVVLISGFPVGAMRPPNMALLHTLGR